MEPASIGSASAAIIGWYDIMKEFLSDFKPETRTLSINFSRKTSQIGFQIIVPDGWRKKSRKIKIPITPGYKLLRMTDEGFTEQKYLWKQDGDYLILDAKDLPSSERYLVEMEGRVNEKSLRELVYIKPAANRDNDDKNDKYWLEASIKKPASLEKVYTDLEIDEINFSVMIDIDKMFGLTIPNEIMNKLDAKQKLLESSKNFERSKVLKAALEYKRQERISPSFEPENFYKLIQKVTAEDLIREHINIDNSYDVGSIDQPKKYVGIVPQNINVQAITRLTLRNPIASGYLEFARELYIEKLRAEFDKLK